MRTITTLADAIQLVSDWTERYNEQATDAQIRRAARALVRYLGGYGANAEATDAGGDRITEGFDLDAALRDPAAVAMGRRGGRATSPAKGRAARANGAKGGRPRKKAE